MSVSEQVPGMNGPGGGSREGRTEPSSTTTTTNTNTNTSTKTGQMQGRHQPDPEPDPLLTSPSPHHHRPLSPQQPPAREGPHRQGKPPPPRDQQQQQRQEQPQQPRTTDHVAPSGFSKFLAAVFGPLIAILVSIYRLVSNNNKTASSSSSSSPEEATPPPPSLSLREEQQQQAATMRQRRAKNGGNRKENVSPGLAGRVADLTLRDAPVSRPAILPFLPVHDVSVTPKEVEGEDPSVKVEREMHRGFIEQALDMARLALRTNETPVGCVLVCDGRVIAKGMNATNITRNGTRHAEYMALSALFAYVAGADQPPPPPVLQSITNNATKSKGYNCCNGGLNLEDDAVWDAVDATRGHIYPYGQKFHPAPRVYESIIRHCTLYVTVEPCVMCASMLRQLGIKKVFFGAVNDKFGGTGGVFRIHMNSPSARDDFEPMRRVLDGKVMRVSRDGARAPLKPVVLVEDVDAQAEEQTKEQAGEQAGEQASEQAKEQAKEQPTEQASDQTGKQANERVGEQVKEFISKRARKRASKKAKEQAGEKAKEQAGVGVVPPSSSPVGIAPTIPPTLPYSNTIKGYPKKAMGLSLTDRMNMWVKNPEPVPEPPRGAMRREGDGGNVEPGYLAEGGWGRDEAVALLRQFYVQENGRAPVPRKKEGRAARLAAMMERDGMNPAIDLAAAASAAAASASAPATTVSTPVPKDQLGPTSEAATTNGSNTGVDVDGANGGQEKGKEADIVDVPTPMSDVT
ncbi:hypothetical protein MAPG_10424 [Magnaporthiopsis poae ATCC 64411]|uniref:CMP/dCMP-type deaminase domain-containing protein n=1 Tax=Magnaporthiopsis poae (strain ATCC 64411 / 73-15) TaxID=644358 RepID=A0A0C4ECJ7_MAGP6|nr:hypothetical protein MAPG_10424 [Magnaporthiopsis poae ATCC 64411]